MAFTSFTTVAFTNFASRVAGSTSAISRTHKSIISCRDFGTSSYEALITSCRYCPASSAAPAPPALFASDNSDLLKTHCVV